MYLLGSFTLVFAMFSAFARATVQQGPAMDAYSDEAGFSAEGGEVTTRTISSHGTENPLRIRLSRQQIKLVQNEARLKRADEIAAAAGLSIALRLTLYTDKKFRLDKLSPQARFEIARMIKSAMISTVPDSLSNVYTDLPAIYKKAYAKWVKTKGGKASVRVTTTKTKTKYSEPYGKAKSAGSAMMDSSRDDNSSGSGSS